MLMFSGLCDVFAGDNIFYATYDVFQLGFTLENAL